MDERSEGDEGRAWMTPGFWAEVDAEIRRLDPTELQCFLRADSQGGAPRAGFEAQLWAHLRDHVIA